MSYPGLLMEFAVWIFFLILGTVVMRQFARHGLWRGRGRVVGNFTAASTPPLSWRWRTLQAAVVLALGLAMVAFAGLTNGPLRFIGDLPEAYAHVVWIVTVCAGVAILIAALLTLGLGAGWGVGLAALTVICYGFVFEGAPSALDALAGKSAAKRTGIITFELSDGITGADLWVNNVLLGKTPVRVTWDEFRAKVPIWTKAPAEAEEDKLKIPHASLSGGGSTSLYSPWTRFSLNPEDFSGLFSHANEHQDYYVRARLGSDWGYSTGGSDGGGSGSRYVMRYHINAGVLFPAREARLAKLLNQVRMNDYQAGPEWFKAMEDSTTQGWAALYARLPQEPRMEVVADAWASWHYGLDKIRDPEEAWRALEVIASEADGRRQFDSGAIAGRAVALLAPRLNPARLIDTALQLVEDHNMYSMSWRHERGRLEFSTKMDESEETQGRFSPGAFAIAQAVRTLNDLESATIRLQIQRKITPALIRWHSREETYLKIATALGGPDIDRYLLRQRWNAPVTNFSNGNTMYVYGQDVNRWLYLLATLDDAAGRDFKTRHEHEILDLAATLTKSIGDPLDKLDFLFSDSRTGKDNLALKFWPQYRAAVQSRKYEILRGEWNYLIRMGNKAPAGMFIEAWPEMFQRASSENRFTDWYAVSELEKIEPGVRRAEVLKALAAEVEEEIRKIEARDRAAGKQYSSDASILRDNSQRRIRDMLIELGDPETLAQLIRFLATPEKERPRPAPFKDPTNWLSQLDANHLLVGMLANSAQPALRKMALPAIAGYPSPENHAILKQLLTDPDPGVQDAARDVKIQLEALRDTKY